LRFEIKTIRLSVLDKKGEGGKTKEIGVEIGTNLRKRSGARGQKNKGGSRE
jgi:hypothetical protein